MWFAVLTSMLQDCNSAGKFDQICSTLAHIVLIQISSFPPQAPEGQLANKTTNGCVLNRTQVRNAGKCSTKHIFCSAG